MCSRRPRRRSISQAASSATKSARSTGKAARERASRSSHAAFVPSEGRPNPVATLARDDVGRLPELLPIRYERMLESPFAFYRGAASIMATDLQATPVSGIPSQICGDAHLLNFGAFGTPERRFVFDVNDFDETTTGAWEWDVKRLATSFEIAARHLKFKAKDARDSVMTCVRSYRERMHAFAGMTVLDVWYARVDEDVIADLVRGADARKRTAKPGASDAHFSPAVDRRPDGSFAIVDHALKIFHPPDDPAYEEMTRALFTAYRKTLPLERRNLFDRFTFCDAAFKVVGVGSVGTRCSVALFEATGGDKLWLQIKEARTSVYEAFRKGRRAAEHGERVVNGQRLMQTSSDLFLGYALASDGHAFYIRQLHDMKTSPNVDAMTQPEFARYANACGWALARAHARASGSAAAIAAYLGKGDAFDDAIAHFAFAYADQNERDYQLLRAAHAEGGVTARA